MADWNIRILVVEDDHSSRVLIANQMQKRGFEATCADDGGHAVEIIKHHTPDCILLDMIMPGMHGYKFLQ